MHCTCATQEQEMLRNSRMCHHCCSSVPVLGGLFFIFPSLTDEIDIV